MTEHVNLMKSLIKKHDRIVEIIAGKSIQYIDVPMYMNIGDHLIAHGTFKFFENNGITLKRASGIDWFRLSWIDDSDVLVFGGGGNFGDLYPKLHHARMRLVKEALVKGKTVIVLPQSLWYQNEENRIKDEMLVNAHPNFHLFTRDIQSFGIAKTISKNVYLTPDMAHHLYDDLSAFSKDIKPTSDVLYFLRKDKEISQSQLIAGKSYDWDDVLKMTDFADGMYQTFKFYKRLWRFHLSFIDPKLNLWREKSWRLVLTGAQLFSTSETIVTDRLHGMILAALLNRNVSILDNSYHKVSNYKNMWFDTDSTISLADLGGRE